MTTEQKQNGNGQSKAIVTGPQARLAEIKGELKKAQPMLAAMLPKHVTIDRVMRIVVSAVSRTPELLACSPRSIVLATSQSCALGLDCNTPLGLGYLVPFKGEAQFIPGYRGLIRLAVQSGEVLDIDADVIYERDTYEVEKGTNARLVHHPYTGADGAGDPIAFYAVATLKNGFKKFCLMTREQVEDIKKRSKASANGPWVTDYLEMAKKTAVRRICKMLPLSEEKLQRALDHQERAETGEGPDFGDFIDTVGEVAAESTEHKSRTDALADKIGGAAS